ncbi:hypothetical protein ACFP81_02125 [Deinococcus lacus]|uniref:Uncharacterized protein n=1 Tax=Deinococcus lacus TaxID=392561 RepID=A0ABW1YAE4_9DEIO
MSGKVDWKQAMLNEAEVNAEVDEDWAAETRQLTKRMSRQQGFVFLLLSLGATYLMSMAVAALPSLFSLPPILDYLAALLGACALAVLCGVLGHWSSFGSVTFVAVYLGLSFMFSFSDFSAWELSRAEFLILVLLPVLGATWLGETVARRWRPFGIYEDSGWF